MLNMKYILLVDVYGLVDVRLPAETLLFVAREQNLFIVLTLLFWSLSVITLIYWSRLFSTNASKGIYNLQLMCRVLAAYRVTVTLKSFIEFMYIYSTSFMAA